MNKELTVIKFLYKLTSLHETGLIRNVHVNKADSCGPVENKENQLKFFINVSRC